MSVLLQSFQTDRAPQSPATSAYHPGYAPPPSRRHRRAYVHVASIFYPHHNKTSLRLYSTPISRAHSAAWEMVIIAGRNRKMNLPLMKMSISRSTVLEGGWGCHTHKHTYISSACIHRNTHTARCNTIMFMYQCTLIEQNPKRKSVQYL